MLKLKLPIILFLLLTFCAGCVTSHSDYYTAYHAELPQKLQRKSIAYSIRWTNNHTVAKKFNPNISGDYYGERGLTSIFKEVFSPAATSLSPSGRPADITLTLHVQYVFNPLAVLPTLLCQLSGTLFPSWHEQIIYLNAIATDNQTGMTKEYLIERRYTSVAQLFFCILAGFVCESEQTVSSNLEAANFKELRHRMERDGFFNPVKPKIAPQAKTVKPVQLDKPAVVSVKNTSSAPTYRVVLDNFNNKTGLGTYAVIFEKSATFADTRAVRNEVFAYARELFCEIRPDVTIEDVNVVTWEGGFDSTKGENYYTFTMSLAAVTPFSIEYDNQSRRGQMRVKIEGKDVASTITWAKRNIASLVERYNRALSGSDDIPDGGAYIFEREETTDDGYYIFHFKVIH